jgi:hypothetical protein
MRSFSTSIVITETEKVSETMMIHSKFTPEKIFSTFIRYEDLKSYMLFIQLTGTDI